MLRSQVDPIRNRIWNLTLDGVALYEASTGEQVAQIPLPEWQWAGSPYGCMPVLTLGPGGEALVSSDVLPVLWRIDPETLAVTRHELALEDDSGKDIGFSGLAYSAQQDTYVAVACGQGSVWRVDRQLKKGLKVSLRSEGASAWAS